MGIGGFKIQLLYFVRIFQNACAFWLFAHFFECLYFFIGPTNLEIDCRGDHTRAVHQAGCFRPPREEDSLGCAGSGRGSSPEEHRFKTQREYRGNRPISHVIAL